MKQLIPLLEKFKGKKVVVVGDIMLDKYIWGEVSRISPEAPVQVVHVQKESFSPGGAANVATNAASLKGEVHMVGMTGDDVEREILLTELKTNNVNTDGVFSDKDKPTIMKMRVMGRSQQLLRVDYEKKEHLCPDVEQKIREHLDKIIKESDVVIISDYAKGVVSEKVIKFVIDESKRHGKPVVVDPKPQNKERYKGATLITPNHAEACQMAGVEIDNDERIHKIGEALMDELDTSILLTRGEKGMSVFDEGKDVVTISTKAKEVYDVTGAGDTVVATAALALAAGASTKEAAILANHAAGIKVGKIGTSSITVKELADSLSQ